MENKEFQMSFLSSSLSSVECSDFDESYLENLNFKNDCYPKAEFFRRFSVPRMAETAVGSYMSREYGTDPCLSCLRYSQTVENYKKHEQEMIDKFSITEKHLKQYDSLLQIKDKRLQQAELAVAAEKETCEKTKKRLQKKLENLEKERQKLDKEKEEFHSLSALKQTEKNEDGEKTKIIAQLTEEISKISKEKDKLEKLLIEQTEANKATNSKLIELKISLELLEGKKQRLSQKNKELKKLESELRAFHEKTAEEEKTAQKKLDLADFKEKQISEERLIFDELKKRMLEESESLDELKEILSSEQKNIEQERKWLQESYEIKFAELEEIKEKMIQKIREMRKEKETLLADSNFQDFDSLKEQISGYQLRLRSAEETCQALKNEKKSLAEELRRNEERHLGIISDLEAQNNRLELKLSDCEKQINRAPEILSKMSEEDSGFFMSQISEELQKRLAQVKQKENELETFHQTLIEEKKSLAKAAEYINTLNEDFRIRQTKLEKEEAVKERSKKIRNTFVPRDFRHH